MFGVCGGSAVASEDQQLSTLEEGVNAVEFNLGIRLVERIVGLWHSDRAHPISQTIPNSSWKASILSWPPAHTSLSHNRCDHADATSGAQHFLLIKMKKKK